MKLIYALHKSACTSLEWDLLEKGDIAVLAPALAAGLREPNEIVAGCKRDALSEARAIGGEGPWALIQFTVRKSDVVHWITADGAPRFLRAPVFLGIWRP
jgi:hypothetical protein